MPDVDYKALVLDLFSLLDEIEAAADRVEIDVARGAPHSAEVGDLLASRFQIICKHGMTVEIVGAGVVGHA